MMIIYPGDVAIADVLYLQHVVMRMVLCMAIGRDRSAFAVVPLTLHALACTSHYGMPVRIIELQILCLFVCLWHSLGI